MRIFCIFILLVAQQVGAVSRFENINLAYQYLKLTKVKKPGTMLVEKCLMDEASGNEKCTSLLVDEKNSCFDFVGKSAQSQANDARREGEAAAALGTLVSPVFLLKISDAKDAELLTYLQKELAKRIQNDPQECIVGIDLKNPGRVRFNIQNTSSENYSTASKLLYYRPEQAPLMGNNIKLVRKVRGIMLSGADLACPY